MYLATTDLKVKTLKMIEQKERKKERAFRQEINLGLPTSSLFILYEEN
jgi:hypothetical protein